MRPTTALKFKHDEDTKASAEVFDFARLSQLQVAVEAEAACHLSVNTEACDFEAFLSQYGEGVASDFV